MNIKRLGLFLIILSTALSAWSADDASPDAAAKVRVVLVGDSTVAPRSGWGNAFGKMLSAKAECFDEALGGRSSKSYRDEGAWARALALKPAWVLIQFGHNDQPGKGPQRETDPQTTFPENLARYVDEVRQAGARPVLITSMTRRVFENGQLVDTLGPYVEATKRVAAEKHVPLIDLHASSTELVRKLGPEGIGQMEPPGKTPGVPDHTHLNARGAEMIAPLVADEIRQVAPELGALLLPAGK